ncbi:N-methylhydantoinase A [Streptosporangium becharense]|uniref:N-methylhydantoinase A n=1 Tax=Streptosporangium becharense TaxID=1816182 RepID=A0A7W9ID87_9ACTN|nr:hydantoinase/oxoprolinase family protein [Streptosporangium becharense]MBB2911995.1 N-methylhydantoinase A [Streptosporangium becharense]MBB5818542.1 N-methylhydantoinase A [Streptosporangium becharense]
MSHAIGVDVGGTFTDVVLSGPGGEISVAKRLSTHGDPADGVVAGITAVLGDTAPSSVTRVVHATTLATNAILERRGVRVAYVTTRGFRSAIPLGRYARVEEDRYDLWFDPPAPPVAAGDCFEVPERIGSRGEVLEPLDEAAVAGVGTEIARRGITTAAVCLLHSYANPAHEQRVARILRVSVPTVVISSEVWPELREYERATTTIMSAYVGPVMAGYLRRLASRLAGIGITAPVHVMDSGGGVMSAELAARRAVATIESGPAAGVLAAAASGYPDAISFDMGGTTAKTCVIRDGRPEITHEFHVGGRGSFGGRRAGTGVPIKTPAVDLAEVGAGGGSVAWVDAAGTLRAGPRSAGSEPGPACYGLGGDEPTVTDANLVLGYLDPASFASGTVPLSADLAGEAVDRHLAGPLGVGRAEAAYAVHEIANASMGSAVHVVTVQRGIDPRGFVMVAFGGAGPMHAARVASRFGISTVVVPAYCGVGSAAGLLTADLSADRVLSALDADPARVFASLTEAAAADLDADLGSPGVSVTCSADVRFAGQAHDLTVPWSDSPGELAARFFAGYRQVYGIEQEGPVEIVSYRVRVTRAAPDPPPARRPPPTHPRRRPDPPWPPATRRAYFPEAGGYVPVPVLTRACLARAPGGAVTGPAIVEDAESTIVVPPGWTARPGRKDAVVLTGAGT